MLDAIGTATIVIGMIQQHHSRVVQPQVQASLGETSACSSALAGLVRSTEERVLACLQAALNAFFMQVRLATRNTCAALLSDVCQACRIHVHHNTWVVSRWSMVCQLRQPELTHPLLDDISSEHRLNSC